MISVIDVRTSRAAYTQLAHVGRDTNLGFWEPCVLYAMKNLDFVQRHTCFLT